MVVFGGQGKQALNDVCIFNLKKRRWETVYDSGTKPSPRARHSAVWDEKRECLYIFGGFAKGDKFADLYSMCISGEQPVSVTWKLEQRKSGFWPPPMHRHKSFFLDSKLHMIGGLGGKGLRCLYI